MNYLAHIYLARQNEMTMLGAMLGDFHKIGSQQQYPPEVETEIRVHRKIDSYTDQHPSSLHAKSLFAPEHRRYAGILLDLFYDHLLANHWRQFHDTPLEDFVARFYRALLQHQAMLPERLKHIAPRIAEQNWLLAYRQVEGFEYAATRISHRLSRNGHLLRAGIQDTLQNYAEIEAGFLHFFPELISASAAFRADLLSQSGTDKN